MTRRCFNIWVYLPLTSLKFFISLECTSFYLWTFDRRKTAFLKVALVDISPQFLKQDCSLRHISSIYFSVLEAPEFFILVIRLILINHMLALLLLSFLLMQHQIINFKLTVSFAALFLRFTIHAVDPSRDDFISFHSIFILYVYRLNIIRWEWSKSVYNATDKGAVKEGTVCYSYYKNERLYIFFYWAHW